MTLQPRTTEEIYTALRNTLVTRISKITNFVSGSFNDAFVSSYAEQVREAEVKALAAEFAGTVDYAGKDLTQSDLDREGVDGVEPEEVNEYMEDRHLDNLAANFGVERFPGSKASGTVELEMADEDSSVEEGFVVGTQPDSSGAFDRYLIDADDDGEIDPDSNESVSPDDGTTLTVDVIANEPGTQFNTGSGTVTYLPNPRPGIQSVTNINPIQNGEDVQSNESLREDVRTSLFDSSGGGTESGIIGYIESNSEDDVVVGGVEEFLDQSPPLADVVIDGGEDEAMRQLIEESRPVGIQHNLVRPSTIEMGSLVYTAGVDIDPTDVRDSISNHLDDLGAGESFFWSSLLQRIMDVDRNIRSIPALNMSINVISQDRLEYADDTAVYKLSYGPIGSVKDEDHLVKELSDTYELLFDTVDENSVTVEAVIGGTKQELDESDFDVVDDDGDGDLDSVVLDPSVDVSPGSTITVDYTHSNGSFTSVTEVGGDAYDKGVDYEPVDTTGDGLIDSIEWLTDGESPDDGERFEMQYAPYRSVSGDIFADNRERFGVDSEAITVRLGDE